MLEVREDWDMLAIELAEEDRQDKAMEAFIIWFTLLSLLDYRGGGERVER